MAGPDRPPAPPRRTRRLWRLQAVDLLLLASILVPALVFGAVAAYDRGQTLAAAERDLLATLDTLHGHAEKVFQLQVLALGAIDERLRGQSNAEVLADAASHHAYLRALWWYRARPSASWSSGRMAMPWWNPSGRRPRATSTSAIGNTSAGTATTPARNRMFPGRSAAGPMAKRSSSSRSGAPRRMAPSSACWWTGSGRAPSSTTGTTRCRTGTRRSA